MDRPHPRWACGRQQRVIASNMANANTLGFRAEMLDQRAVTIEGQPNEARAMQPSVRGANMVAGEIVDRSHLDIAIETDALMAQAVDGSSLLPRRPDPGNFVNGEGRLLGENAIPFRRSASPESRPTARSPSPIRRAASPRGGRRSAGHVKYRSARGLDGLFRVAGASCRLRGRYRQGRRLEQSSQNH